MLLGLPFCPLTPQNGPQPSPEEQAGHQRKSRLRTWARIDYDADHHANYVICIQSLSEEEQKLFRLYGKLPNKKDLLGKKLQERKYFDSGDYALSKAGKSDASTLGGGLGREHPT